MFELAHASMVCPHYTLDGLEMEKTVIIGPIKIYETVGRDWQKSADLVVGCNFFYDCENMFCAYSRASRQERRKIAEQVPLNR